MECVEVPSLANIKSSEKDIRRSLKRRERNQAVKSAMKTYIRRFKEVAASDDEAKKEASFRQAQSAIDRAVQKGVIKRRAGARYKSRLAAIR